MERSTHFLRALIRSVTFPWVRLVWVVSLLSAVLHAFPFEKQSVHWIRKEWFGVLEEIKFIYKEIDKNLSFCTSKSKFLYELTIDNPKQIKFYTSFKRKLILDKTLNQKTARASLHPKWKLSMNFVSHNFSRSFQMIQHKGPFDRVSQS